MGALNMLLELLELRSLNIGSIMGIVSFLFIQFTALAVLLTCPICSLGC